MPTKRNRGAIGPSTTDAASPPACAPLIREAIAERGWSQRELGRQLGWTSAGRVSEILSGKRELTLSLVRDLCRVLELSADQVVFGGGRQGVTDARAAATRVRTSTPTRTPTRAAETVRRPRARREFDWM